MGVFRIKAD